MEPYFERMSFDNINPSVEPKGDGKKSQFSDLKTRFWTY